MGVNKAMKESDMVVILKKILIRGLKGIECKKLVFLDIYSKSGHYKFLLICMMI